LVGHSAKNQYLQLRMALVPWGRLGGRMVLGQQRTGAVSVSQLLRLWREPLASSRTLIGATALSLLTMTFRIDPSMSQLRYKLAQKATSFNLVTSTAKA